MFRLLLWKVKKEHIFFFYYRWAETTALNYFLISFLRSWERGGSARAASAGGNAAPSRRGERNLKYIFPPRQNLKGNWVQSR